MPKMTPDDLAAAAYHLRCALQTLEQEKRHSSFDISAKTILSVLKRELDAKMGIAIQASRNPAGSDSFRLPAGAC